ncbi:MAG: HAD-IIB family hydrolase [Verrucomicrobiae bacterium]|nr:HAD-IIB family hydrolase [Verrucomicrobiae bacterium]NNJ43181.1 HAD-IIB family hydrolase [Akkermansiaceae bacterium]
MIESKKLLIVTDLDATLLTEDYSFHNARPAIHALKDRGFPIILNSSKTLAELVPLARELDIHTPIIAENGGHIAIPKDLDLPINTEKFKPHGEYLTQILGLSRHRILEHSHALRIQHAYKFAGFADWSAEEISQHTGLSLENAKLSADRYVTEPILWNDSEINWDIFKRSIESFGGRALRGGQFIHLMGTTDKADGLRYVRDIYRDSTPNTQWVTVALGDSANDRDMLNASDIAVVIPHSDGPRINDPTAPQVIHAEHPASRGWNDSILEILSHHTSS